MDMHKFHRYWSRYLHEWVSFLGFYIWMFVSFHRLTSQYLSNQATMWPCINHPFTWRRLHQSPSKTTLSLNLQTIWRRMHQFLQLGMYSQTPGMCSLLLRLFTNSQIVTSTYHQLLIKLCLILSFQMIGSWNKNSEDVPKQVLCKTRSTKGVNILETQSTVPPVR
jgi:hypothetical protein